MSIAWLPHPQSENILRILSLPIWKDPLPEVISMHLCVCVHTRVYAENSEISHVTEVILIAI